MTARAAISGARWWRAALPGTCAVFVGLGIARFGYTPMIPALVTSGTVSEAEAAYLGAANLVGYLLGALLAALAARLLGPGRAVRLALAASVLGLAACVPPLGYAWFLPWRFLVGVSGAVLMVLGPSVILARTSPTARGRTGGVIYAGVGLGAAIAGCVVAPVAALSIPLTWAALTALAAAASLVSWRDWEEVTPTPAAAPGRVGGVGWAVLLLLLAYTTDGAGSVPHLVFWADYVTRGLAYGAAFGTASWVLFSLGAMLGPPASGLLADRIGLRRALVAAFAAKATCVALAALAPVPPVIVLSSLVVGALCPGLSSLVAGRIAELVHPALQTRHWGMATLLFSVAQAAGAAAMSLAFARLGTYTPLYLAAAALLTLGLALALAGGLATAAPRPIMAARDERSSL